MPNDESPRSPQAPLSGACPFPRQSLHSSPHSKIRVGPSPTQILNWWAAFYNRKLRSNVSIFESEPTCSGLIIWAHSSGNAKVPPLQLSRPPPFYVIKRFINVFIEILHYMTTYQAISTPPPMTLLAFNTCPTLTFYTILTLFIHRHNRGASGPRHPHCVLG